MNSIEPPRALFNCNDRTRFAVIIAAIIVLKLWLVAAQPLLAIHSPHDDTLFVRLAHSVLRGEWLGVFNEFTLIKGPMYPLFIAGAHLANIPLQAAEQLLYAFACVIFVVAIGSDVQRRRWRLVIFVCLLFNPFTYHFEGVGRVLRLGIYPALSVLVLACSYGLASRLLQRRGAPLAWAIGLGLVLAMFWHTREESVWVTPSLALLALFTLIVVWRRGASIVKLIGLGLLAFGLFTTVTLGLDTLNWRHYHQFGTIEIETPQFEHAYGQLLRIEPHQWVRFFPVLKESRELAYKVSPAARELEPYLEGSHGQAWTFGWQDIPAAFFIWAFRDAAAAAGHYHDPRATLAYYQRLGDELEQACADVRLPCLDRGDSLIPPWHAAFNRLVLPTFLDTFKTLVTFATFSASTNHRVSIGSAQVMQLFAVVTRENLRTSKPWRLGTGPDYDRKLDRHRLRCLNAIGHVYQTLTPALFGLALLSTIGVFGWELRRRSLSIGTVFAGAILGGIVSICAILTLIQITSYSSIGRPITTAYPLVIMFIIISVLNLAGAIRRRR